MVLFAFAISSTAIEFESAVGISAAVKVSGVGRIAIESVFGGTALVAGVE